MKTTVSQPTLPSLDEVRGELNRAKASLWLLDQLEIGELSFLRGADKPPCWESKAACERMDPEEIKDWLRHMATENIAQALAALDAHIDQTLAVLVGSTTQGGTR